MCMCCCLAMAARSCQDGFEGRSCRGAAACPLAHALTIAHAVLFVPCWRCFPVVSTCMHVPSTCMHVPSCAQSGGLGGSSTLGRVLCVCVPYVRLRARRVIVCLYVLRAGLLVVLMLVLPSHQALSSDMAPCQICVQLSCAGDSCFFATSKVDGCAPHLEVTRCAPPVHACGWCDGRKSRCGVLHCSWQLPREGLAVSPAVSADLCVPSRGDSGVTQALHGVGPQAWWCCGPLLPCRLRRAALARLLHNALQGLAARCTADFIRRPPALFETSVCSCCRCVRAHVPLCCMLVAGCRRPSTVATMIAVALSGLA
jgi:hypothetical protein